MPNEIQMEEEQVGQFLPAVWLVTTQSEKAKKMGLSGSFLFFPFRKPATQHFLVEREEKPREMTWESPLAQDMAPSIRGSEIWAEESPDNLSGSLKWPFAKTWRNSKTGALLSFSEGEVRGRQGSEGEGRGAEDGEAHKRKGKGLGVFPEPV